MTAATQPRGHRTRRHPPYRAFLLLAVLLAVTACGRPSELGRLDAGIPTITEEELGRLDLANAYQAIERLRPDFLRTRGQPSIRNREAGRPVIYVGGVRQQGGPEVLREVRLGDVREIQHLSAADATTRYGTDHAGGAILVVLR